jgi:hypothetical protein
MAKQGIYDPRDLDKRFLTLAKRIARQPFAAFKCTQKIEADDPYSAPIVKYTIEIDAFLTDEVLPLEDNFLPKT